MIVVCRIVLVGRVFCFCVYSGDVAYVVVMWEVRSRGIFVLVIEIFIE